MVESRIQYGPDRSTITTAYVRVCQDSGWELDAIRGAQLVAGMLGIAPLEVLIAVGSLSTMEAIARGDHAACKEKLVDGGADG